MIYQSVFPEKDKKSGKNDRDDEKWLEDRNFLLP